MRFLVDVAALRRIGAELVAATDVLHDIRADRHGLGAQVADSGHDDVRRAATQFIEEWAFGAGCLADDAETLAGLLLRAEAAYVEIDDAVLAAWFDPTPAGPTGGGGAGAH